MRSDDVGVIGVTLRKELVEHHLVDDAVRAVLDALPALVANDVLLIRKFLLVQAVQQVSHAIGLEPQAEFELIRRERLEVVGPIEARGAVDVAAAGAFDEFPEAIALHVLRPVEHHVLEQVREAGPSGLLVRRSHVVPDVHRNERQTMVFREDDLQPVGQGVLLEGDIRNIGDARRRALRTEALRADAQETEQEQQSCERGRQAKRWHQAVPQEINLLLLRADVKAVWRV